MSAGASVEVDALLPGAAWIGRNGKLVEADLRSKVNRCLFENAAILDRGGEDVEMLNKAD